MQINKQSYRPDPCPSAITFYDIQNELYTAKQYNSKLLSISFLIKVLKIKRQVSKCTSLPWGKNQHKLKKLQKIRKKKKRKRKMFVYEQTRQKQKKKNSISTLTLQRGWGYPHPKWQEVHDGQHTPNVIWPRKCWNKYNKHKHAIVLFNHLWTN